MTPQRTTRDRFRSSNARYLSGALVALVVLGSRSAVGQMPVKPDVRMELGLDLGVSHAAGAPSVPASTVPLTLRVGWLDTNRRTFAEFGITNGDPRVENARRASSSAARIGWRLRKNADGKIPFSGPFVFGGGGVTSLRSFVRDAPLFRFMPSVQGGIGTRQQWGNNILRFELVTGFDRGYAGPDNASYVPSRRTASVRVGYSALRR